MPLAGGQGLRAQACRRWEAAVASLVLIVMAPRPLGAGGRRWFAWPEPIGEPGACKSNHRRRRRVDADDAAAPTGRRLRKNQLSGLRASGLSSRAELDGQAAPRWRAACWQQLNKAPPAAHLNGHKRRPRGFRNRRSGGPSVAKELRSSRIRSRALPGRPPALHSETGQRQVRGRRKSMAGPEHGEGFIYIQ